MHASFDLTALLIVFPFIDNLPVHCVGEASQLSSFWCRHCCCHWRADLQPHDSDNYSVFVVNYYPKTAGTEWKADTNRISPHTDETLVTLLFTSPGAV